MVSVDELQQAKAANAALLTQVDDFDLTKKQIIVNYLREKDLGSFS